MSKTKSSAAVSDELLRHFPDYDVDTLPAIPAEWLADHQASEGAPSWLIEDADHPGCGLLVWVEVPDINSRAWPCPRYQVARWDGVDITTLLRTSKWSEVLALVRRDRKSGKKAA